MSENQGPPKAGVFKVGPVVKIVAIPLVLGAGIVIGFNLFGGDESQLDGTQPPATGTTVPGGDESQIDGTQPPATNTTLPPHEIVVMPAEMFLESAEAHVTGLGSGAYFRFGAGGIPKLGGAEVQLLPIEASEAACTLTKPIYWAETAASPLQIDPLTFDAGIIADANNHVSVAGATGVVIGGFSIGGEGRGNHQEWPLSGGDLVVEGWFEPSFAYWKLYVIATWQGTSVENFKGYEASGTVRIGCEFVVLNL